MSEENKLIAIAFYEKLINEFDPESAFALHGGESYTQHIPVIEDGREGVTKFISGLRTTSPESHMEIKKAFSDGDIVILHCHWVRSPGNSAMPSLTSSGSRMVRLWSIGM
jgi:predicted SnoaL-like aldol condensation-catalyzing enzyme